MLHNALNSKFELGRIFELVDEGIKKKSNLYLTHAIKSALGEWQRCRVQIDMFLFKGRIKYNRGRFKTGDH